MRSERAEPYSPLVGCYSCGRGAGAWKRVDRFDGIRRPVGRGNGGGGGVCARAGSTRCPEGSHGLSQDKRLVRAPECLLRRGRSAYQELSSAQRPAASRCVSGYPARGERDAATPAMRPSGLPLIEQKPWCADFSRRSRPVTVLLISDEVYTLYQDCGICCCTK